MQMDMLLLGIIGITVAAYFVYAYGLYRISTLYHFDKPWLAFVPLANKFLLVKVGDVCEDGMMYIPIIKMTVSRNVMAALNTVGVLALFMVGLIPVGYVLAFLTSVAIWYDVESGFEETGNAEIVFDAILSSIGIHSYPAYVMFRYHRFFEQGKLFSTNAVDDVEDGADYEDEYAEYPVEDDRYIEEDDPYEVYTEDDAYTKDTREILDEY